MYAADKLPLGPRTTMLHFVHACCLAQWGALCSITACRWSGQASLPGAPEGGLAARTLADPGVWHHADSAAEAYSHDAAGVWMMKEMATARGRLVLEELEDAPPDDAGPPEGAPPDDDDDLATVICTGLPVSIHKYLTLSNCK